MEKYKKYIFPALAGLFVLLFLISAGVLISEFVKSSKNASQNDELANLKQQATANVSDNTPTPTEGVKPDGGADPTDGAEAPTEPLPSHVEVAHPVTGAPIFMLREYAEIFRLNPDTAGWIHIDGTEIDYPVMWTPGRDDYYYKRDFYKKDSKYGCIYAEENASLEMPSDNVTLYGHNMNDGSMFAGLHNYRKESFYKEHSLISFDTLYEHHTYKIIAVFDASFKNPDTSFYFHMYVDGTEQDFNNYVAEIKSRSIYDTGETAVYGDKLITLCTCDKDYSTDHGRFVVVAKRIS